MAKNKGKSVEKNEKKKKLPESTAEVPKPKKKKLNTKVSEDPVSTGSQGSAYSDQESTEASGQSKTRSKHVATKKDKAEDNLDLEDLNPEERRVLERKLKKERKKEEKRLQRERGVTEKKEEDPAKPSAAELALQYLESWSKKQPDWKFQKTRQTWLLMNMYDPTKVTEDHFRMLLDYMGGLKGSARETTIQKAEAYMKESDSSETQEESDSQRTARIREVLQLLS
ncbi:uncharacterized protein C7orf50 homolog [Hyperolius riggenbachi]|uniref:uncharacterized protein C7orf50 homolog n=1 Tax=Hyperolius riggenbachi TaxID=752182 RepID=UPI0035A3564C